MSEPSQCRIFGEISRKERILEFRTKQPPIRFIEDLGWNSIQRKTRKLNFQNKETDLVGFKEYQKLLGKKLNSAIKVTMIVFVLIFQIICRKTIFFIGMPVNYFRKLISTDELTRTFNSTSFHELDSLLDFQFQKQQLLKDNESYGEISNIKFKYVTTSLQMKCTVLYNIFNKYGRSQE
jgi:hypothetical protein